jgi:hypothetical protein
MKSHHHYHLQVCDKHQHSNNQIIQQTNSCLLIVTACKLTITGVAMWASAVYRLPFPAKRNPVGVSGWTPVDRGCRDAVYQSGGRRAELGASAGQGRGGTGTAGQVGGRHSGGRLRRGRVATRRLSLPSADGGSWKAQRRVCS